MAPREAIEAAVKRESAPRAAEAVEREILLLAWERAKARDIEPVFLAALGDGDLSRVRRTFVREAVHELGDRHGMLVSAAAEGSLGTRPAAEVATVARLLRDLDAGDCRELRRIAETKADQHMLLAFQRYADAVVYANGVARREAWEASPSRDLLEIGLLKVDGTYRGAEGFPLFISARGEIVLALLRAWA